MFPQTPGGVWEEVIEEEENQRIHNYPSQFKIHHYFKNYPRAVQGIQRAVHGKAKS